MVTKIDETTKLKLKETAREAAKDAMCPYSHYSVGAALLMEDGRIVRGFNIENPAFTPTVCAERTAIFSAFTQYGYKKGTALAIAIYATDKNPASPCGVCRQVMSDTLNPNTLVILNGDTEVEHEYLVKDLLPYSFTEDSLK